MIRRDTDDEHAEPGPLRRAVGYRPSSDPTALLTTLRPARAYAGAVLAETSAKLSRPGDRRLIALFRRDTAACRRMYDRAMARAEHLAAEAQPERRRRGSLREVIRRPDGSLVGADEHRRNP